MPLRDLGVPAGFHPHGTRAEILAALGLTAQDVARDVTEWVSQLEDPAADADQLRQGAEGQRAVSLSAPLPLRHGGGDLQGGNTIVIDLGLDRGEPETYASPSRSTVPDWFGPLVVGLLVLVSSAASAAPPPPALSPVLSLRVGPADSYALTDDRELLAQTLGTISAYDLADGDAALAGRLRSARPTGCAPRDGLVLMRPWTYGPGEPSTTALSLATGAAQWRRAGTVMTIAGSSDPARRLGGAQQSGTNRRVQGPVESLDPRDRRRPLARRRAVHRGAARHPRPGRRAAPDAAAARQPHRGACTTWPPARCSPAPSCRRPTTARSNPTVSGGLLLLRHLGPHGPEVSAYDPVTLRQRVAAARRAGVRGAARAGRWPA